MICRNAFLYRAFAPVIVMLLFLGVLAGCTREKDNPDEASSEMIDKAQKDLRDIVTSCVTDNFDADINIANHMEAIRSNPMVDDVKANDSGLQVTYTNGEVQCFIYDYGSIFDGPEKGTKSVPIEESFPETRATYSQLEGKKIYIFNLFSEDSSRANQNDMVNTTASIFRTYFGSGNVRVYGFKEFTVDNLEAALKDRSCVAVYIYSFGLDQNIAIGGGYYQQGQMYAIKVDNSYAREYDSRFYVKMTPAGNYVSQMLSHDYYGVDIQAIISTKNASDLAGKLVYLSSCNTLSQSFSSSVNACVAGWDGVNKLGEAYGLIMTHYMVDRRRDLKTFQSVFKNSGSDIEDKYAGKGARFRVKGGMSNVDYWSHAGFTVPETKTNAKVVFTGPNNGGCIDTDLLFELGYEKNTKIRYKYNLDAGESIGVFESTHPGGYVYFVHGNNLKGDHYYGSLLDCKWSSNTTVRHFEPGVMRYELIQQSKADWDIIQHRDCSPDGDWKMLDAIYVITPKRFKENDAGQSTPPDVRSIAALKAGDKMYAYGGIVDMDGAGFKKGFQYWKKGNPSLSKDVESEVDENLFYAALPDLKKGEEYTFKAYLVGPDDEYYWSEPCDFVSEVNSSTEIATEPTPGDLIDLGLSVKWASCNLGAAEPQDPGDYYAWGETQTKSNYDWSTYLLSNGSSYSLKKYCSQSSYGTVDNRKTLELADDAAFVNTSGKMRMPTAEECRELREKCQWTETQYKGRNGYLVYSATTGNAIFIPKNGLKFSYVLNTDSPYYWTADLSTDESFRAESFLFPQIMKWDRCDGLGIRPVSNSQEPDSPEIETITVNGVSFKMVRVKGGTFTMKSDFLPSPQTVTLKDFSIGQTEVTQELWEAVMGYNPSVYKGKNHPVESVSWNDCQRFLQRLNSLSGKSFSLPMMAEYEYAASGGQKTHGFQFAGSNEVDDVAWYLDNSDFETHSVGLKMGNELGLYDLSGNVWEISCDYEEYDGYCYHRTFGGSIANPREDVAITSCVNILADDAYNAIGFRLAISSGPIVDGQTMPVPVAIDLGLSVKWASFNLGANRPEEYGDYYAWGETEPYYSSLNPLIWKEGKEAGYNWLSYRWCMGSDDTMTKYCLNSQNGYDGFTDGKTVLDLEDDAAHVNLGGKWRMPTKEEQDELREKCSWEWTQVNGINGRKVTGPSGNSIFLPAAGNWGDRYINYAGSEGYYWSSSLDKVKPSDESYLYFNSIFAIWTVRHRYYGLTIRPVCDD